MKKKKRNKGPRSLKIQKELDRILSGLSGTVDYTFDHQRSEEPLFSPRVLSVAGNRELFNSLALRDYHYLRNLPILAAERILPLLLPQSVWGRARNGHGMFCDEQGRPLVFADATFDHVITGIGNEDLGIHGLEVKRLRQRLLDNLEKFLLGCLETERAAFGPPDDEAGNPLGVKFLDGVSLDTSAFLKGFALGVMMDNWRCRQQAAKHFRVTLSGQPLVLGGGESLLVDYDRFIQVGLTEEQAADEASSAETLGKLRELRVIVPDRDSTLKRRPVGVYFRRMIGPGISDDAAIVYLGKTYGVDALYGCFVADAADTYDKYLADYVEGGTDEKLLQTLRKRLGSRGKSLADDQEVRRMIYFSAKANDPPIDVSSSHRRLIQVEPGSKKPTLLNHLTYVDGGEPARIPMGYNRYDSDKFYAAIAQRAEILRLGW
ncbi:MAG: hypothetical protein JXQ83_07400 [Candidatus Glassbacteria bacterium]|nr:hypothetical protein [Candidatus Glassbacteria bacterium]